MGHALLFPEAEKGGRGKKKVPETGGFSRQRLREARQVLAFSRELALKVRDGSVKLDQALATVARRSTTKFILSMNVNAT